MLGPFRYWFVKRDEEAFAALAEKVLRSGGHIGQIDRNADGFSLRLKRPGEDEGEMHLGLTNFYRMFFESALWHRGTVIDRMVRTTLRGMETHEPTGYADAAPHLLPALRDGFLLEASRLRFYLRNPEAETLQVPTRPFASGSRIVQLLVVDRPESVSFVQASNIEEWREASGKDFDELFEVATENLKQIDQSKLVQVAPGLYQGPWSDDHDVARLLLDETLKGLDIQGDPVVAMPTRNHLFVTGSHNEAQIAALLMLAEQTSESQPSLISNLPLVRRWPNWEALVLAPTHPAYATWSRMRAQERGGIYEEQKALLDAVSEQDMEHPVAEFFVASFRLTEREDGLQRSFTQWTRDVVTLLPEADRIAFYDTDAPEGEELFMVEWADAFEICAELMEPWGEGLARWAVREFPSAAQLKSLRAAVS